MMLLIVIWMKLDVMIGMMVGVGSQILMCGFDVIEVVVCEVLMLGEFVEWFDLVKSMMYCLVSVLVDCGYLVFMLCVGYWFGVKMFELGLYVQVQVDLI